MVWLRAWLSGRVAILSFDGQLTEDISVKARVPQGSPLLPILFILYIATLYEALKRNHPMVSIVGLGLREPSSDSVLGPLHGPYTKTLETTTIRKPTKSSI